MKKRLIFSLAALGAFAGGFVAFSEQASRFEASAARNGDGVVVLTGGVDRIAAGAQLVSQQRHQRLLISGVNDLVTREDMLSRIPQLRAINDCCLDLGYRARNTIGNALEARDWAERHRFKSLIVVTAASHMPRAMAEFAHAMPQVTILARAAGGERLDMTDWWRDPALLRVLAIEYVKYLFAAGRIRLEPEPGAWFPGSLRETGNDGGAVSAPAKIN